MCMRALVAIKANRTAKRIKLKPHTDLYDLIKLSALLLGSKERSLFSRVLWKRLHVCTQAAES